jgi:hypothetical protein
MALEIEGKVLLILPEQSGTSAAGKTWVKQELVIETEDQYPKKVCVTGMGEKIVPVIKSLTVGQKVTVHINVESKEYQDRWFSNINVWRIDKNAEGITNQPTETVVAEEPKKSIEEQSDDLPF